MNKSDTTIKEVLKTEDEVYIVGANSDDEPVIESFEPFDDESREGWISSEDEYYDTVGDVERYVEKQYKDYWVFADVEDAEDFYEFLDTETTV